MNRPAHLIRRSRNGVACTCGWTGTHYLPHYEQTWPNCHIRGDVR
jgi:hypothetical protein